MNYALEATENNNFQQRRGGSNYQNNNSRSFQNNNPNNNYRQGGNYQSNQSYNNMNYPQQYEQQSFGNNQSNSRNYQQQRGGGNMGYNNFRGQPHQNQYSQNNNRQNNFHAQNNNYRSNNQNHSFNNGQYYGNQNNFGNNGRGEMGNRDNWNNQNNGNQKNMYQVNYPSQNYHDTSDGFQPQTINNSFRQQNFRQSVSPTHQINYQDQSNQDRANGGYNKFNTNERNDNNFNRGRGGGRGRGRGSFGGNGYNGQRNQYQNNRGQEARYEPQRELSQAQLAEMLRQRNNSAIQIYPNFTFPHAAAIENRNQIYIFANNERNKISNSQGGIISLKGPKKIDIPSNAGLKNFYEFPGLPNRGELQRERVLGFKQSAGMNFNDFQRRGMELMQQIIGSLESYK